MYALMYIVIYKVLPPFLSFNKKYVFLNEVFFDAAG